MTRVLIVEDSVTEASHLSELLKSQKIQIAKVVATAELASQILKEEQEEINLIFLDVVLPGKSGFEFCRALKNNQQTKNIPVIICSSKNTEIDKKWGLKQGASAYLTKPVDKQELMQVLRQLNLLAM